MLPRSLILASLALAAMAGCATPVRTRSFLPPLFRSLGAKPAAHALSASPGGPSGPVERALKARGLRFGTDGSVSGLAQYLNDHHQRVSPKDAQPGDVVFFDFEGDGCRGHVGLVDEIDGSGRITFREWRTGGRRSSHVFADAPRTRRDGSGRILNTFLRPKRPEDPAGTRYFAGEMLCAVYRARGE